MFVPAYSNTYGKADSLTVRMMHWERVGYGLTRKQLAPLLKILPGTDALAYLPGASVYITLPLRACFIKLFVAVINPLA